MNKTCLLEQIITIQERLKELYFSVVDARAKRELDLTIQDLADIAHELRYRSPNTQPNDPPDDYYYELDQN